MSAQMKNYLIRLLLLFPGLLGNIVQAAPEPTIRAWQITIVIPRPINITETALQDFLKKKGVNAHYTVLQYEPEHETPQDIIARIRATQPDLIYTWGTPTTLAVAGPFDAPQSAPYIRDIPIVFNTVTNPVASRLVPSLTNQQRNLTGVMHIAPLLTQLNTIKAYRPFKHIGYIYNPLEDNSEIVNQELQKLSHTYPFQYTALPVPVRQNKPDAKAIPRLVSQLAKAHVDILYLGPDTFISFQSREVITQASVDAKISTFSSVEEPVRASKALFGLYTTNVSLGRFAAFKIAQILQDHISVSRIPLESLRDFTLLINIPIAKQLNNYPPLPLLEIADTINADPLNHGF